MKNKNLALMVAAMSMMSAPSPFEPRPSFGGYSLTPRGPQGFGNKTKRRAKQKAARQDRQANRRRAKGK